VAGPLPNERFGRYRLLKRIALGGMAEIWLAAEKLPADEGAQVRTLVIKRILPHYAEHPEFVAYFVNEGSIGTRLHHPHIIETFEQGQIDNQYYLAMEYIKGVSLLDVLRRAVASEIKLPLGFAVDVVRAAAAGLAHAHEACDDAGRPLSIVHRDVSPHNILLGFDGTIKVLDFGVAKAATQLHHTKTGTIKGKLSYVAPEQLHGGDVDARTDIFALGIVLHETVAGRPLFRASNEAETLARVMRAEIPLLQGIRPDCPPELERIVRRALDRRRDQRYPSAREMAEELAHVRAFLPDEPDVVRLQLATMFPGELAREDPRPPTGSWSGEVIRRAEELVPRRSRLAQLGMIAVSVVAMIGLLEVAHRTLPHDTPAVQAAAAKPVPAPKKEPEPTPPPLALAAEAPAPPPAEKRVTHARAAIRKPAPAVAEGEGHLRVIVSPWAEVSVDGKAAGMTPSPPMTLAAGPHTVVLKNGELGREVKRKIVVPAGGEAVVRVDLFRP
jgi:eukaryotic-like serine/threonine-protein kinase